MIFIFFSDLVGKMLSSEEEDHLDLTATPRSRREQLIEVVDNYKEKLRQIKGQVRVY